MKSITIKPDDYCEDDRKDLCLVESIISIFLGDHHNIMVDKFDIEIKVNYTEVV